MLEVVAPFKHFNKLKEFVAMKLPAGFPVRIGWCRAILPFILSFIFPFVLCHEVSKVKIPRTSAFTQQTYSCCQIQVGELYLYVTLSISFLVSVIGFFPAINN